MKLLLALCWFSVCAFGWGREGHKLIASMAEARLSPKALEAVRELLGDGVRLADISTCADDFRSYARLRSKDDPAAVVPDHCLLSGDQIMAEFAESAGWHYVNIPIPADTDHRDAVLQKACASDCVTAQIHRFAAQLADKSQSPQKRAIALLYLTHLVADLHQPLHAVDRNRDEGGNLVFVLYNGRAIRLHSFWDTAVVLRLGTVEPKGNVDHGHKTPESWAWEGYDISRKIYKKIPTDTSEQKPFMLSGGYIHDAERIARERLFAGAVRLADVLNGALS